MINWGEYAKEMRAENIHNGVEDLEKCGQISHSRTAKIIHMLNFGFYKIGSTSLSHLLPCFCCLLATIQMKRNMQLISLYLGTASSSNSHQENGKREEDL